jgi:perosamine synthetase
LRYVTECILTGWVSSSGKFVTQFEEMFADFCDTKHAIATSNGTCALHLALLALDVGPDDEVIVPSLTFIATANAVTYTGARPVFVDSERATWNIDPEQIEAVISPRTKAIIPVHLYGHPADMDAIMDIATRNNLVVVEDAAEAHGARYKGQSVGGIGHVGVFSFYGNKIVTTGEGGMLVTNRDDIAERARILRDHGMAPDRRYWHLALGYNYRMTNLQAALGVAQMEKIDEILAIKHQIAATYAECLQDVPGLHLPPDAEWAENVYWLYSVLIESEVYGRNRDELVKCLVAENIETRPVFPPVHTQPIYETDQTLPVAEHISEVGLSLPSAVSLKRDDIVRITTVIKENARNA